MKTSLITIRLNLILRSLQRLRLSQKERHLHFVSQSLNRRQIGRPPRRISRRRDPDQRQSPDGERRRLPRDDHSRKPRGQRQQIYQFAQPDAGAQTDRSAEQRQEKPLAEELPLHVARGRAEGFADAYLSGPLFDRDEHDVHHARAAQGERDDAHRDEEFAHARNHLVEEDGFERRVPYHERLAVRGVEAVPRGGDRKDFRFDRADLLEVDLALAFDNPVQLFGDVFVRRGYDGRYVIRRDVIAGHREVLPYRLVWHEQPVVVRACVIRILLFLAHASDDGVGNPVELNLLPDGVAVGEQLLVHFVADDHDSAGLAAVLPAE